MTTATKITFVRLFLIPVFVAFAVHYADTVAQGKPSEWYRWAAVATFIIASLSDALDGYIARRFNQQSRLGRILDPAADKGLLFAAIVTLTVSSWPNSLPLWFTTLVISRDVGCLVGALLIQHAVGKVHVRPHWSGKVATFFQMVALAWVMLGLPGDLARHSIIAIAGVFTLLSAIVYSLDGLRQAHDSGLGEAGTVD